MSHPQRPTVPVPSLILDGVVSALSHHRDVPQADRAAKAREVSATIDSFGPMDTMECMLVAQALMLHQLIADACKDAFSAPRGTVPMKMLSTLNGLHRSLHRSLAPFEARAVKAAKATKARADTAVQAVRAKNAAEPPSSAQPAGEFQNPPASPAPAPPRPPQPDSRLDAPCVTRVIETPAEALIRQGLKQAAPPAIAPLGDSVPAIEDHRFVPPITRIDPALRPGVAAHAAAGSG